MENLILSIRNLFFSYGAEIIFKNLSIDFEKNKIHGIVGSSGAGKTTFLKIISLLFREYSNYKISGKVIFQGENILELKKDFYKVRQKIIYIPQKPVAFKTTIFKNITFPVELSGRVSKKKLYSIVEQVLIKVNLFEEVKKKLFSSAEELSGGQLQRLSIARALTLNPEILLFDEPTSSLDEKNVKIIEDLIVNLKKETTIFFVSHNLNQVNSLCDEIYQLKFGALEKISKNNKM